MVRSGGATALRVSKIWAKSESVGQRQEIIWTKKIFFAYRKQAICA